MTRGATRRAWVKVYITGWLHGSIRWQLTPEERSVWCDLICLAGECGKEGKIVDNDGRAYPLAYLAGMFYIPEELLTRTIDKCVIDNRVIYEDGIISIINWKVYQSEYERQKQYQGDAAKLAPVDKDGKAIGYYTFKKFKEPQEVK